MIARASFLLLVVMWGSCTLPKPVLTIDASAPIASTSASPTPSGSTSAGPAPVSICDQAYAHIVLLKCVHTEPSTMSWSAACANARAHGNEFPARCISKASSCDAVYACRGD